MSDRFEIGLAAFDVDASRWGEASVFEHLQGDAKGALFDDLAARAARRAARRRALDSSEPRQPAMSDPDLDRSLQPFGIGRRRAAPRAPGRTFPAACRPRTRGETSTSRRPRRTGSAALRRSGARPSRCSRRNLDISPARSAPARSHPATRCPPQGVVLRRELGVSRPRSRRPLSERRDQLGPPERNPLGGELEVTFK